MPTAPQPQPEMLALGEAKLPRIAVVYAYAGQTEDEVRDIVRNADGVIVAGVGAGGVSSGARKALRALADKNIPMVTTPRQGLTDHRRTEFGCFAAQVSGLVNQLYLHVACLSLLGWGRLLNPADQLRRVNKPQRNQQPQQRDRHVNNGHGVNRLDGTYTRCENGVVQRHDQRLAGWAGGQKGELEHGYRANHDH